MDLELRYAEIDELDEVLSLYRSNQTKATHWDEIYPSRVLIKDDIETFNQFVVKQGDEIVGSVAKERDPDFEAETLKIKMMKNPVYIARFVIKNKYQHMGYGKEFLRLLEEKFSFRYEYVWLLINGSNAESLSFFTKNGYKKFHEGNAYNGFYYWMYKKLK